ncbi:MAG: MurT ligase domain-containing protein [Clostridia bacterium]
MKFKIFSAIIIAKTMTLILRLFGSGGTSLPGKAAMMVKGDLLSYLSKDVKTILITGTNGKTTTARIIAEILKISGKTYFENKSGANLISGITATFAVNSSFNGKINCEFAVIECDEAAFKTVGKHINASLVIVTNLFRDQLDRYGEITHTLNGIIDGIRSSRNAVLILNADDSLSYSIKGSVPNETFLFGMDSPPYGQDTDFISDAPYCIKCKGRYAYDFRTYAHLGGFRCPECGYQREKPDYSADEISLGSSFSKAVFSLKGRSFRARVALPGAYNIYNALAAAAAAGELGIRDKFILDGISTFRSGFGRMEVLSLDDISVHMILVKNPAGLNQVINFLANDPALKILVMILNDRHADGTDISWIWDANFEKISAGADKFDRIILSGTRAEELLLRFKYSGIDVTGISATKSYPDVILKAIDQNTAKLPVYILPTYTAMFDFRKALSRKYKIKKFWK